MSIEHFALQTGSSIAIEQYLLVVGAPGYSASQGRALVYNTLSMTSPLYVLTAFDSPTPGGL
jgi:hypothetical protein